MARRMLTISEMYNKLKSYFVDKASTSQQELLGNLKIGDTTIFAENGAIVSGGSTFSSSQVKAPTVFSVNGAILTAFQEIGNVATADLMSSKITARQSGIYHYYDTSLSRSSMLILNFSSDGTTISGINVSAHYVDYFQAITFVGATFSAVTNLQLSAAPITFSNVTSINSNLGGTPLYGVENSTLHIKGAFTPTATIAAGTKLFSTGQTLGVKMTHGSAINSGTAGSETFVGISIQTNGDVYCLGALTSGVTYSIAVTAT